MTQYQASGLLKRMTIGVHARHDSETDVTDAVSLTYRRNKGRLSYVLLPQTARRRDNGGCTVHSYRALDQTRQRLC